MPLTESMVSWGLKGEILDSARTICFERKDEEGKNKLRDAQRKHEVEGHVAWVY